MKFHARWAGTVLMHRIARYILGAVLLIPAVSSHAASLVNGDVLSFTSAAGSYVSGSGYNPITNSIVPFDSASLNSLNGLIIGTAQPTFPGIDQTWVDTTFVQSGNHYTTSPVNVLSPTTLDFSGWALHWSGFNLPFGATQGVANYSFDGTNFTLDYSWNAVTNNGGVLLSGAVADYQLHLVGTVSSVPIPAAVWLFCSGLLGLIGMARRKAA